MSSSAGNFGDAVRSDGTLKDTSEIVWSYDADDSIPFPSSSASATHPISVGSHTPATVVAAVCQTNRISRPSRRYLEEDKELHSAPASKSSGVKRKAASTLLNRRATCKTINVVSDDDCDGDSDGGTPSPPPTELASDDYESLKAMADADNQVCTPQPPLSLTFSSKFQAAITKPREERTADIHLLFHRKKEYIHPVTGKCLDGHWCNICW
jgi:hypothetical protein